MNIKVIFFYFISVGNEADSKVLKKNGSGSVGHHHKVFGQQLIIDMA